jgi:hypothetical protein
VEFISSVRRICIRSEVVSTEEILASAPRRMPGAKREQYRTRFTEMIRAGNLGTAWKEQLAGGLVLGGNDFVAKVRKLLKGDRTEQKSIRTLENPPVDWATIVAAIEKLWSESWEDIRERRGDPGRGLAMVIAWRYGGMRLRASGDAVGGLRYPAVSDAVRRFSAQSEADRGLEKRFKKLCRILKL